MPAEPQLIDPSHIVDVTIENFQQAIVERSLQVPVVIDFWAPWCGPCRQLTPLLHELAAEFGGKFVLAKVNTEEQPQLAGAFGVQSIPHVVAFFEGQPVDQFVGLLPKAEIREWILRLIPSPAELLAQAAAELEPTDPQGAESKYREALTLDPSNEGIQLRLASLLLSIGRTEETKTLMDQLAARGFLDAEGQRIQSELELRAAAAETGGVAAARAAVAEEPDNLLLKIRLADALGAAQQYREALELGLEVVQLDRGELRNTARQTMVQLFQILGPASELTGEYRRRLTTALY